MPLVMYSQTTRPCHGVSPDRGHTEANPENATEISTRNSSPSEIQGKRASVVSKTSSSFPCSACQDVPYRVSSVFHGMGAAVPRVQRLQLAVHLFEFMLVCTAIIEVYMAARAHFDDYSSAVFLSKWLSALRMLRLSHYSRLLHICRLHFFSELMMVSGALSGMRAIGWRIISRRSASPCHCHVLPKDDLPQG